MRIENWCGYDIRFVEINGEWWAILKDICDALGLRTAKVAERLEPNMLERVKIEASDHPSRDVTSRARKTQDMLAVNEEAGLLMQSVTVQGGDVEQIVFEA